MHYTDEEHAEDVALLQEVLSGRPVWTFQADHGDVEDLENLPTFPATRTTLPLVSGIVAMIPELVYVAKDGIGVRNAHG